MADGLTKPLLGQSFKAFLVDLGIGTNPDQERAAAEDVGRRSTAVMSLMAGSLLLSGTDSV